MNQTVFHLPALLRIFHRDNGCSKRSGLLPQPFCAELKPNAAAHILIIEDNPAIQRIYRKLLSQLEWSFTILSYAKQALLMPLQNFQLVFLDTTLPDMNSLALCHMIRQRQAGKKIPIIVLSNMTTLPSNSLDSGATAVILKPLTLEKLREVVLRWLLL